MKISHTVSKKTVYQKQLRFFCRDTFGHWDHPVQFQPKTQNCLLGCSWGDTGKMLNECCLVDPDIAGCRQAAKRSEIRWCSCRCCVAAAALAGILNPDSVLRLDYKPWARPLPCLGLYLCPGRGPCLCPGRGPSCPCRDHHDPWLLAMFSIISVCVCVRLIVCVCVSRCVSHSLSLSFKLHFLRSKTAKTWPCCCGHSVMVAQVKLHRTQEG